MDGGWTSVVSTRLERVNASSYITPSILSVCMHNASMRCVVDALIAAIPRSLAASRSAAGGRRGNETSRAVLPARR